MAGERGNPEDLVTKLRQVEVLHGQGLSMADAVRQIGISQHTLYQWRKPYCGMNRAQLARLKELQKENLRLRRAVSDLTLEKLDPDRGCPGREGRVGSGPEDRFSPALAEPPSPSRRRECVEHMRETIGIAERRARRVLGRDSSTQRSRHRAGKMRHVSSILRGDAETRFRSWDVALRPGALTVNEAREAEVYEPMPAVVPER